MASDRDPPAPVEGSPDGEQVDVLTVSIHLVHRDGKLTYYVQGLPQVRHPLGDIEGEIETALGEVLAYWRKQMTAAWLGLGRNR